MQCNINLRPRHGVSMLYGKGEKVIEKIGDSTAITKK